MNIFKSESRCLAMPNQEAGFILILVLLLLTLLSLSAFMAFEQSQLVYKSNNARMALVRARQISEGARLSAISQLQEQLSATPLKLDNLTSAEAIENLKTKGFKFLTSMNQQNERAQVYLKEMPVRVLKNGTSLSQGMVYSGLGVGLGKHGSFSTHFEIRAEGLVMNKGRPVSFWTASDYRFVP